MNKIYSSNYGGARPGSGRKKGNNQGQRLSRLRRAADGEVITETEARERFRILNEAYDWYTVLLSQEEYPDIILERNGKELRAEVELNSSHFRKHKHNEAECDFVRCWKHDYLELPLPVLEICALWKHYRRSK